MQDLIYYPDGRLQKEADPLDPDREDLDKIVDHLLTSVREYQGVGLAGPQVGLLKKIMVVKRVDLDDPSGPFQVMINPFLVDSSEETEVFEEGCLSIPGIGVEVERPSSVTVQSIDQNGEEHHQVFSGQQASIVQHEMDHLDGTLLFDHLSETERRLKRREYRRKRKKFSRQGLLSPN